VGFPDFDLRPSDANEVVSLTYHSNAHELSRRHSDLDKQTHRLKDIRRICGLRKKKKLPKVCDIELARRVTHIWWVDPIVFRLQWGFEKLTDSWTVRRFECQQSHSAQNRLPVTGALLTPEIENGILFTRFCF